MVRLRRLMLVMPNQEAGISVTLPFVHSTSYVQNVPMRTNAPQRRDFALAISMFRLYDETARRFQPPIVSF
jgi:hypothetical protein